MIRMSRWHATRRNTFLENVAYPLTYAINRPSLNFVAKLVYDFALRCNGIGIAFPGQSGLTRSEEKYLRRAASTLHGATILDVGANSGSYASFIKDIAPDSKVYAFEPHPKTFAELQKAARNRNFVAVPLAVSDTSGTVRLYDFADQDGSTQASLGQDTILFQTNGNDVAYDVESTTLDEFTARSGIDAIDFLKVDTEGFDLAVLKGAARLLAARRIKVIQFEIIPATFVVVSR